MFKKIICFVFGIPITSVGVLGVLASFIVEGTKIALIIFIPILLSGILLLTLGVKSKKKKKPINPYVDVSLYQNGTNTFPEVHYTNVFLQQGEWIIYAVPAKTFIEKEQVVGYTGSSAGVSVRVAKGVSVRSGSRRGTPVRQNVRKFNSGDYVVTNKRVLFVSQNDGFEFNIGKISTAKIITKDTFFITIGNKQKNICVDESQLKYAYGTTVFAINQNNENIGGIPQPPYMPQSSAQQLSGLEYTSNNMASNYTNDQVLNEMRSVQEAIDIMGSTDSVEIFLSAYENATRCVLTLQQAKKAGIPVAELGDIDNALIRVKKEQLWQVLARSFDKRTAAINIIESEEEKLIEINKCIKDLEKYYRDEAEFIEPYFYNQIALKLNTVKEMLEELLELKTIVAENNYNN